MQGWIKLHRQITEWEWYKNIPVKVLFLHCLMRANHEDKKWQGVLIKKGSFITSLDNLAFETGLSKMQVRIALDKLKLTHEITYQSTHQYSMISINNWDKFQLDNTPFDTQITHEQHTNNTQITLNNNDNNEKNDKEVVVGEKLYGEYQNVFLTNNNYNKLLTFALSQKLLDTVIDEFSEKVEEGVENQYSSSSPNAHFIRIKKYLEYRRKNPDKFIESNVSNISDAERIKKICEKLGVNR